MEADVRLVHLRMKRVPSRTKSLGRSASSWTVSDMVGELREGGEREVKRGGRVYREGERAVIDSRDNLAFRGPEHRVSPLRRCVQHQTELSPLSPLPLLFLPLPLLSFPVPFFSSSLSPRSNSWARTVGFPGPRLSTSHDPCTIGIQSGASVFSRIDQLAWRFN